MIPSFLYIQDFKPYVFAFALRPLNDLTFEVGVRINQIIEIVVGIDQLIDHKFLRSHITFIKVDRADNCFKRVAENNLLKVRILLIELNNVGDTDFARQEIQGFAVHNA